MRLFYCLGIVLFALSTQANAGFEFRAAVAGDNSSISAGTTSFDLESAGGGTINIYIVETPSGGSTFNLQGSGFVLDSLAGTTGTISNVSAIGSTTNNVSALGGQDFQLNGLGFPGSVDVDSGIQGAVVGSFDVSGTAGTVVNFSFVDPAPGFDNVRLTDTTVIDGQVFAAPLSYSVAVPEPSSVTLLSLAGLGLALRRRRS